MSFTDLHVHTDNSLLDGLQKPEDVAARAKELGRTACAITDHGTMSGAVSFYDACKEQGIKAIIGEEFYEAPISRTLKERTLEPEYNNYVKKETERIQAKYAAEFPSGMDTATSKRMDREIARILDNYNHIVLLAKNEEGYKNLCRLTTKANEEGFYSKPRIDWELLERYNEGLICLSACIGGRIPKAILRGETEYAEKCIERYKSIFGDDFYLEIQNHGLPEEEIVRQEIPRLAAKHNVKVVATSDSHYSREEDAEAHKWLKAFQQRQSNKDLYIGDFVSYYDGGNYSLRPESEMRELFKDCPEAIDNTQEIVDKIDFDFEYGHYRMPEVKIPEEWGSDYMGYLEHLAWKGFESKYPISHERRKEAEDRLKYELSIIDKMGFAEYFLDTRKTIVWAHGHGIMTGPGRGSGAGSVMNYCLGITDIEPLRYGLLFERFLNPSRISMPDIDVDYEKRHKDEVIASESDSNGHERFAKIRTFGTLAAKGVAKDCARVAFEDSNEGIEVGNEISKLIGDSNTLQEAWDTNPDLQQYIKEHKKVKDFWPIALKLEGTKRNASTHACGHIPTPINCEELFPCAVDSETGYLICEYDMVQAEHLGNLKKDLLMLRNLTIINVARDAIKENHNKKIPLWTDEILNDRSALETIALGDTNGVFQLEGDGMTSFMRNLKPTCFEDIIAGVALYRPGPMDYIPQYIENKHNPENIKYLTPQLEPILKSTYGIIIYQEEVMQIVQQLGGFDMGRADLVRKAMGKKNMEIMQAERQNFVYGNEELGICGCIKNGISEDIANTIYDQMIDFAKYAFNKSHAAGYAAIAMETAYLKANYPLEFYAGLLTSVMDETSMLAIYLSECKRKGLVILPPDINSSREVFSTTDNGELYYGLSSIKKVGKGAVESLVKERIDNGEYHSLYDFLLRNPQANKGLVESLITAGAFDFTGFNRPTLIDNYDFLRNKTIKKYKEDYKKYRNREIKESIKTEKSVIASLTKTIKKEILQSIYDEMNPLEQLNNNSLIPIIKDRKKSISPESLEKISEIMNGEDFISCKENPKIKTLVFRYENLKNELCGRTSVLDKLEQENITSAKIPINNKYFIEYLNSRDDYQEPEITEMSEDWSLIDRVMKEKEVTGTFISYHPLDAVTLPKGALTISEIMASSETLSQTESKSCVCGYVSNYYDFHTKRTGKKMANLKVEDSGADMKIVVFPSDFEKFGDKLKEGIIMSFSGNVNIEDNGDISFIANAADEIKEMKNLYVFDKNVHNDFEFKKVECEYTQTFHPFYKDDKIGNEVFFVYRDLKNNRFVRKLNVLVDDFEKAVKLARLKYGNENVAISNRVIESDIQPNNKYINYNKNKNTIDR